MSVRLWLLVLALWGCSGTKAEDSTPLQRPTCAELEQSLPGAPDVDGIAASLAGVGSALFPTLEGVSIELDPISSTTAFFQANVRLDTIAEPPRERVYLVQYSEEMFALAPPSDGVVAILAHELVHVSDYVGMDTEALGAFAIEYATGDVSAYERATDEGALERGCAAGLIAYREWLYGVVDEETRAEKERDYYTPEEIRAWVVEHGG